MVDLSGLNRAQRRRLERKMEKYQPPSLQEWLSKPGKVVKRGEAWNLAHRVYRLKKLEERYNSWPARIQRFVRRLVPWVEDPPPNPFAPAEEHLEEAVAQGEKG